MPANTALRRSTRSQRGHFRYATAAYTLLDKRAIWPRPPHGAPAFKNLLLSLCANGNSVNTFRLIWVIRPFGRQFPLLPEPDSLIFRAPRYGSAKQHPQRERRSDQRRKLLISDTLPSR